MNDPSAFPVWWWIPKDGVFQFENAVYNQNQPYLEILIYVQLTDGSNNELCAYATVIETDYLGYLRCYKMLERNLQLDNISLFRFISSNST